MIYPGHGAKSRPQHLKIKDRIAGAQLPFDWSAVKEDAIGNVLNLFGIPDNDQNGSSSCTCQTMAYGVYYCTGIKISIEDVYAHVHLPQGGAYLTAPLDFGRKTGFASGIKYPDPVPETEQAMTALINIPDGDRIKTLQISYTFYGVGIDDVANAIQNHNYIHLGIRGSFSKGWDKSWVDPIYIQEDFEHALFAGKESIVLRNGIPAIKTKSSWNQHFDPSGNQVHCHYINKNYFEAGGVFETIGVDIVDVTNMVLTADDVAFLQALEGYNDPAGIVYWTGKTLAQYKSVRVPDKIKSLQSLKLSL